jgi:hypothetical protein
MKVREAYEAILFEQNKEEAPIILRDKFVYMLNKAINGYSNEKYNFYSLKQVSDDDMGFLLGSSWSAIPYSSFNNNEPKELLWSGSYSGPATMVPTPTGFEITLPDNYRHLTRLSITLSSNGVLDGCGNVSADKEVASRRLVPDTKGFIQVSDNAYLKPSKDNVYHYFKSGSILIVEYGGNALYRPSMVSIDYIMNPPKVNLTPEQLESEADTSDELPFNDRVAYEIINKLTASIFENTSDPRIQTFIPLNKTINEGPVQ